jgi:hypothetical protein
MDIANSTDTSGRSNRDFFQTPRFMAATVGIPFAAFKLLFGLMVIRNGLEDLDQLQVLFLGWPVIIWASVDLVMNLISIIFDLMGRETSIEFCSIAQAGRIFGRPRLFLAVDTLVSFTIICIVLWSGWIGHLSFFESKLWILATIINLISVALVSLWVEIHRSPGESCKVP